MVWYSVRPMEILEDDPQLFMDLRALVIAAQLQMHPEEAPQPSFVLRADTNDTDSVYIHVGEFTPIAEERFTLSLLRERIGNDGTGIKARGSPAGAYEGGLLTEEQNDVMVQALDYMATKTEERNAMDELHMNNGVMGFIPAGLHLAFPGGVLVEQVDVSDDELDVLGMDEDVPEAEAL